MTKKQYQENSIFNGPLDDVHFSCALPNHKQVTSQIFSPSVRSDKSFY